METYVGILLAIVALLVCLLITVIGLLIYSGLFYPVEIRAGQPPFDNITIAYKFALGPYKNAGTLFTEVHNYAPTLRSIGLYYDDPNEVASSKLRYAVGVIISEGEDEEDSNKEYTKLLVQKGYKLTKLPSVSHAVTTSFPFKNTISIFLAVARIYPKLLDYIKERNLCAHPMIEIYDEDIIHFVAPLAKQDEFYVCEAAEGNIEEKSTDSSVHMVTSDMSDTVKVKATCEEAAVSAEIIKEKKSDLEETVRHVEAPVLIDDSHKNDKRDGSNGSGDDSTGSSFEELNVEAEK